MGYMDENCWNTHQTDDETQKILVDFFHSVANDPYFQSIYLALNDDEKRKLHTITTNS